MKKAAPRLGTLTDEELVDLVRKGTSEAATCLLERYKNQVRSKARMYYLAGADREDIIQEGMIGLYNAIWDYREERQTSFRAFSDICITRKMITAVKTANRQKNIPLNSYVSLYRPIYEEESERTLMDILPGDESVNPEERLINREHLAGMVDAIDEKLSPLERGALKEYLQGSSYEDIARNLGCHTKAVDNALQRIKKKMEQMLREESERSMTPEERESARREKNRKDARYEAEKKRFMEENMVRYLQQGMRLEKERFRMENDMRAKDRA